jgi:phosphate-selective porin OprO/OprP
MLPRLLGYLVCSALALLAAATTRAEDSVAELKARLDARDREIRELKAQLLDGGTRNDEAVKRILDDYLAEKARRQQADEAAAKQKLEDEGFQVGSVLGMTARWNPQNGPTFETANRDFVLHIGAEFMQDNVWFTQSPGLKNPAQFGELEDGTFFRRIRIFLDGTAWQVFEWNLIFAIEQVKEGIPNLSEFWAGAKDIPLIGRLRVGQQRLPQGLEGDTSSSSRAMTFMEASSMTDAFYQRFGTGVLAINDFADLHGTWSATVYRQNLALHDPNGADFGDGKYAFAGRVTYLPWYENEGRCLLHLGVSANWRKAENADPGLADPGVIRFRARPELRDATGDYPSMPTGNPNLLPGNAARLVDTGNLAGSSTAILGTEVLLINGPLTVSAEWAFVVNSDVVAATGPASTRSFNGGYVAVAYFLTGENRTYTREYGRLSRTYLTGPNENFWLTSDEDGRPLVGRGAWELAARWDYLNLNDGPVQGGVMTGLTLGVNWFLNHNTRIEFNYIDDNRYSLKKGQLSGDVQGIGSRVYIQF